MSEYPFLGCEADGVIGLGLSPLTLGPAFSFLQVFAGDRVPKVFAFFLADGPQEKSELAIGGWGMEHADGDLVWNPVLEPELGHWLVKIKSVRVDGMEVDHCSGGCRGVMDTGSSIVAVPTAAFSDVYLMLKHAASEDGMCNGAGPVLHFELEHITVSLGPEHYAYPEWYGADQQAELAWPTQVNVHGGNRTDIFCRPMLMAMDVAEPIGPKLFVLGESILRRYYTVFDTDGRRVGVGKAAHKPAQTPVADGDELWFYDDA